MIINFQWLYQRFMFDLRWGSADKALLIIFSQEKYKPDRYSI